MKLRWSSYLTRLNKSDRRKELRSGNEGEMQGRDASGTSGLMFFHAYCTGAIEKHMQDRGLPARSRRRASREAGD
jgi:hypothetical protein